MKRPELVQASIDPLSALGGGAGSGSGVGSPLESIGEQSSSSSGPLTPTRNTAGPPLPQKSAAVQSRQASLSVPAASSAGALAGASSLQPLSAGASVSTDPDDIVVDSERQKNILQRQERKEHQPLYVGAGLALAAQGTARTAALSVGAVSPGSHLMVGGSPAAATSAAGIGGGANHGGIAAASASAALASSASAASAVRRPVVPAAAVLPARAPLPLRSRDWVVPVELSRELCDDWDSHGRIPGEKSVMAIPDVLAYNAHDDPGSVSHSIVGTLFMTTYQLFIEPTQRRDRLGQAVLAIPLSTMDRIELDKQTQGRQGGAGGAGAPQQGSAASGNHTPNLHYLDIYSKDGRYLRFGFLKIDECKRAFDCLTQYVFPSKEEFLFAFYYRIKTPLPKHLNGWEIYDPLEEVSRQGISTVPLQPPASLQSESLRLSWANESYTMCASYPRVFVVPSEKYVSDIDLLVVAQFRSRGRIPVCTWKHPHARTTIWRCSQPRVGMNNARCMEDEKLLSSLTNFTNQGEVFAIYDCRPRFNARANILAGKGFENPDLYRNAVKKIYFMDIQNIHVMREAHAKLVKVCQREGPGNATGHEAVFLQGVANSGWLGHIATCLKATAEMVKSIDQDKISLLIHCSDGWDRTAQLASLCQLCLDPFYRTTRGFFVLIEKDWLSYGHQFARRTGHRERNYTDDQRSCIFLQWCDTVYQLTHQFPRHFEFNSHMLVTLVQHLYSCRFGTFFFNSDMHRRKMKMNEKTVSVWTYFICSPAAIAGEFTNQLYCPGGNGAPADEPQPIGGAAVNADAPADDVGRSSVGRGGGDGSRTAVGTVLYPSWTLKGSVRLWSDYFLRWNNDQCEQIPVGPSAGSVAPYGAATTRLVSGEAALHSELRRMGRENALLVSGLQSSRDRIRELELELQQLKYGLNDTDGDREEARAARATAPTAAAASFTAASSSSSIPALAALPPAAASASVAAAPAASVVAASDAAASSPAPVDPEDAAIEAIQTADAAVHDALKARLQREVDKEVREDEAPEDPRTL